MDKIDKMINKYLNEDAKLNEGPVAGMVATTAFLAPFMAMVAAAYRRNSRLKNDPEYQKCKNNCVRYLKKAEELYWEAEKTNNEKLHDQSDQLKKKGAECLRICERLHDERRKSK